MGMYIKINVIEGNIESIRVDLLTHISNQILLNPSIYWVVLPNESYSIIPIGDVKLYIEFYKQYPETLFLKETTFKSKYEKSPHRELQTLLHLAQNKTSIPALDIGCWLGRNSIFMADNGYCVTSIDRNIKALLDITQLAKINGLDISSQVVDLNTYSLSQEYGVIISTVVLQFLAKSSALTIVSSMQSHTIRGGYNLIIVPIDCQEHICPIRFPWLFQEGELKGLYANWEIIEYNEMLGTFHRKDELWNKIIARFATMIAKKK